MKFQIEAFENGQYKALNTRDVFTTKEEAEDAIIELRLHPEFTMGQFRATEAPEPKFKKGDIVKHKASFLRSCAWYTNVPINGLVTGYNDMGMPMVVWNDQSDEESHAIREDVILLWKDLDPS